MFLAYALPFFCEAMLYFGALGCFGLLRSCRDSLFWVPVLLLAGCWLSGRLTGKGRPWWLRWLPMAVAVPCMIVAGNGAGRVASLPMLVYMALYISNNRRAPDYDYAADRFRYSLIAAGLVVLLSLLFRSERWKDGLPYLFLYFTLNVALLRLLRHDDRIARSARFRLINLGGVALVCGVGFGLSQPGIVAVLRSGWQWFLDKVVLNLLALMAYIIQWALYLISLPLAWLGVAGMEGAEMPRMNLGPGSDAAGPMAQVEVKALPPIVRFLIKALGVALLAVLAFLILRALSRRVARTELQSGTDEREALDDADQPRDRSPRLRRNPQDGVRQQYRRALELIHARGGRVTRTMNTLQIQQENASVTDPDAMRALREIYLPVRYGGRDATREDVKKAREEVERMRKA